MNDKFVIRTIALIFLIVSISYLANSGKNPGGDKWEEVRGLVSKLDRAALIMEARTGKILFNHESDKVKSSSMGFPPGSTIKPFTALAHVKYSRSRHMQMNLNCPPSSPDVPVAKSCWYRPGHGNLNLTQAIAFSCDAYFRKIAFVLKQEGFLEVVDSFGLDDKAVLKGMNPGKLQLAMVGLAPEHRVSPVRLAEAYSALYNDGLLFTRGSGLAPILKHKIEINPHFIGIIHEGMRQSAIQGTAMEAQKLAGDVELFAKTGTSMYTDGEKTDPARTHGWFVGVFDVEETTYVVVVFVLEGTGSANASPLGGKIINKAIKVLEKPKTQ